MRIFLILILLISIGCAVETPPVAYKYKKGEAVVITQTGDKGIITSQEKLYKYTDDRNNGKYEYSYNVRLSDLREIKFAEEELSIDTGTQTVSSRKP